ncbi:MAG: dipeptidase [Gemmatimonas sp.]|uniref:dipeptidase n=1 Tax=Gemmatimonas sp. TaxID=1962908 RepID=UPI0039190D52
MITSRNTWVRVAATGLAVATLGGAPLTALPAQGTASDDAPLRRAQALLREVGLVDTHNDLPWVLRLDPTHPMDLTARDLRARGAGDTDLPKLRDGGVGTQFWSVYVPSDLSPLNAMRAQLEQIDLTRRLIARYPRDLGFAASTADIRRVRASGRIASLLGIEGGHVIANSLGALRAYYDLGVRYMTLTHFHSTDWADAATELPRHGGLTPFGREVVREMNRLGMLVDISHVSPAAMSAVLDVTEAPVIFSHSSARALTDHVRNVPDSILQRMARNGGVVQVNFVTVFVSEPLRRWSEALIPRLQRATSDSAAERLLREWVATHGPMPRATLKDVADHVEHIRRVAGVDHVGIGADFYGATGPMNVVEGIEDVSRYPALFAELIRRGWSDADLRKLAGGNVLRVFAEAERVAARLQRTREPSTATIEALDGAKSPATPPGGH